MASGQGLSPIHRLLMSAIIAAMMFATSICLGQSGDPVAKITVGKAILLRSSGSKGVSHWHVEPLQADQYIEKFDGMLLFRAWEWPGHPEIVCLLFASDGKTIVTDRYVIPADGDDPFVPPPADDLSIYVNDLADVLSIDGRQQVADMFAAAVPKINSDKLRGSQAIVGAVGKPIAALESVKWKSFSKLLFEHLLNDLKLVTQSQWATAYESIVVGLESKGESCGSR